MGGISIWQLLIIVAIVVLLFGTKKLRTLGSDLGESIKGFKKAIQDDEKPQPPAVENRQQDADFKPDSITEQQTSINPEQQKSQIKE